MDPDKVKYILV